MSTGRLEAFSDAVIAILMTIMVLELKVPHEADLHALQPLLPVFLTYALSFVNLAIYWNNHHQLLHSAGRINGAVLWANAHLLFWLSLFPFATGWMGENHLARTPTAAYGVVSLLAAMAYFVLQSLVVREQGPDSPMRRALANDVKGKLSPVLYAAGIAATFVSTWLAVALYVVVALMWLGPDRRLVAV